MFIVLHKKFFILLSAGLVCIALALIIIWPLTFGVDFTGGSIFEVSYAEPAPSLEDIDAALEKYFDAPVSIRETGESNVHGYIIRTPFVDEETQGEILRDLEGLSREGFTITRLSSVGPSIGSELRSKSLYALLLVILMIIFYVAFAFRKVSLPVSSWKYGIVAIIALVHDVIIPTGVFALLGRFAGYEVDVLFVTALLAILGFSVNDTIVVFDRIRENLHDNEEKHVHESFPRVVGKSLSQTLVRSVNTSLTVFIAILFLFLFAGEAVRTFAVTMLVGVVAGSYSSIFLASPLLIVLARGKD